MGERAHTKGPWFVRESRTKFSIRGDDVAVCSLAIVPYSPRVEEGRANARLIAAAPDMFEALRELVAAVDDGLCNSGVPGFDGARLDRALFGASAALSKATPTGEASDV